ncbi:hypothetical protein C3E98_040415 [Pseudomonas sp. MWU13-2625]|nr:hypothetical protein C3E98_040415 [Pseudomonas sp. MWU13-2625]
MGTDYVTRRRSVGCAIVRPLPCTPARRATTATLVGCLPLHRTLAWMTPSLASQLLRGVAPRYRCRSRLAGEEALEPSACLDAAFAGKPAPTGRCAEISL